MHARNKKNQDWSQVDCMVYSVNSVKINICIVEKAPVCPLHRYDNPKDIEPIQESCLHINFSSVKSIVAALSVL